MPNWIYQIQHHFTDIRLELGARQHASLLCICRRWCFRFDYVLYKMKKKIILKETSNYQIVFNPERLVNRKVSENVLNFGNSFFVCYCDDAKWAVLTAVSLRNVLRVKSSGSYMPNGVVDFEVEGGDVISGAWRNEYDASFVKVLPWNRKITCTEHIRLWSYYFYGLGLIEWQWKNLL